MSTSNALSISDKDTPRRNPRYDLMMRMAHKFTPITLYCSAIRDGITLVLTAALELALHKRRENAPADISNIAQNIAPTLTTGCMLALYSRLRTVNKGNLGTSKTFLHTVENFEIPTPYTLAFQYLGIFRVENLTHELELIPTVSDTYARTICGEYDSWSPTAYQKAVEFARSLGISFQKVDLTVKLGSAWWLLKSNNDAEVYSLDACLPESNYTPKTQ